MSGAAAKCIAVAKPSCKAAMCMYKGLQRPDLTEHNVGSDEGPPVGDTSDEVQIMRRLLH